MPLFRECFILLCVLPFDLICFSLLFFYWLCYLETLSLSGNIMFFISYQDSYSGNIDIRIFEYIICGLCIYVHLKCDSGTNGDDRMEMVFIVIFILCFILSSFFKFISLDLPLLLNSSLHANLHILFKKSLYRMYSNIQIWITEHSLCMANVQKPHDSPQFNDISHKVAFVCSESA